MMHDAYEAKREELFNLLVSTAEQPFSGWDFAYISSTGRMVDAPHTWSYASILLPQLRRAQSLLDIHTGGGEYLSALQPLPPFTCATEGYAPNVPVARRRLEPLGVQVYAVSDNNLPFADEQFDLVINRHGSYSPHEVKRVLKSGGQFITQQVGGSNYADLTAMLDAPAYPYKYWQLDYILQELRDAGWHIVQHMEDHPITRFFDVGALVYYLKAVPWQVPDFSLDKYIDKLVEIHHKIQQDHYIDFHQHHLLIVAHKL